VGSDADIIRRVTDEAHLGGNVGVIDELFADDFVDHDPPPGVPGTKEGSRELAQMVVNGFSDRKAEFDEYLDTSDGRVVENWAMTGTHSGEVFGLPPSNQAVRVRGVEIWRCAGGKIVEHWGAVDLSDVFEKAQGASG
jgi:steroid delta-isomerase-like uncharacterized protein